MSEDTVPTFQQGTQKIHIKTDLRKNAAAKFEHTHSEEGVKRLIRTVYQQTLGTHERVTSAPMDEEDYKMKIGQEIHLLLAKKLATALDPENANKYSYEMAMIRNLAMSAPTPLSGLAEHYGYVDEEDFRSSMVGQPFLAFSYFARALHPQPDANAGVIEVDRVDGWFINRSSANPYAPFFDYARGIIAAWSNAAGQIEFNFNGERTTMSIPVPSAGFTAYQQLVGGIVRPTLVARALSVAVILEEIIDGGQAPTDAQLDALRNLQTYLVQWRKEDASRFILTFNELVSMRLVQTFSSVAGWGEVRTMSPTGSTSQLLNRASDALAVTPFKVPGGHLGVGWMLSGQIGFVVPQNNYSVFGETTADQALTNFVANMFLPKTKN